MDDLPNEILDHVLQTFSAFSPLLKLRLVSKRWAVIVNNICRRRKLKFQGDMYDIFGFYTRSPLQISKDIEIIPWSAVEISVESKTDVNGCTAITKFFGDKIYSLSICILKNDEECVSSIYKILSSMANLIDLKVKLPEESCDAYFPELVKRIIQSRVNTLALHVPFTGSNDGWTLLATQKKFKISKLVLDCYDTEPKDNGYDTLELLLRNCLYLKELGLLLRFSYGLKPLANLNIFKIPRLPNLQSLDLQLTELGRDTPNDGEEAHLNCSKFRTEQFPSLTVLRLESDFEEGLKLNNIFDTTFPSVQSLSLPDCYGVVDDSAVRFPNLKTLATKLEDAENMVDIVAAFPNLEELKLTFEIGGADSSEYFQIFTHFPSLKRLRCLQLYTIQGHLVDDACSEILLKLSPLHLRLIDPISFVSKKRVAEFRKHHLSFEMTY